MQRVLPFTSVPVYECKMQGIFFFLRFFKKNNISAQNMQIKSFSKRNILPSGEIYCSNRKWISCFETGQEGFLWAPKKS